MPAVRCFSRIDTFEIKLQIGKRLGSQKAAKYFNLLAMFLSQKPQKLKQSDFEKLCVNLIGQENLRLHNELLFSILKNGIFANSPPQTHTKNTTPLTLKLPNGSHPRTSLQSLCAFPQSPKKGRTPNLRERKFKDRQLHTTNLQTKTVQQQKVSEVYTRSSIRAPFGVDIHSKETRKVVNTKSDSVYKTQTCHYAGKLAGSSSLKNRLKHNLETEGLDVSMECVDLLNNGLDSFLKRVLKPSLELSRLRSSERISVLDFRVATEINPMILGEVSHVVHENC